MEMLLLAVGRKAGRPPDISAAAVPRDCTHVHQLGRTSSTRRPVATGRNSLRPTAPLPRNHPHLHARDSSRGDCAPLPSSSWGPSHLDAAAAGYSGRVAYSFSVIVFEERTSAC